MRENNVSFCWPTETSELSHRLYLLVTGSSGLSQGKVSHFFSYWRNVKINLIYKTFTFLSQKENWQVYSILLLTFSRTFLFLVTFERLSWQSILSSCQETLAAIHPVTSWNRLEYGYLGDTFLFFLIFLNYTAYQSSIQVLSVACWMFAKWTHPC